MSITGKNESLVMQTNDGVDDMKKKRNKAIYDALFEADMSQTKLAELTGMHLTHINAIVNGSRPNVDTAIRIARALSKTVEELWGDEVE